MPRRLIRSAIVVGMCSSRRPAHRRTAMIALVATGALLATAAASQAQSTPPLPCDGPIIDFHGCPRDPLFARQLPQLYRLGTFNMAGGNSRHGDSDATADALAKSITSRGSDIVFLQEACKDMTARLKRRVHAQGYDVQFLQTIPFKENRCFRDPARSDDGKRHKGSAFGIAIAYRSLRFPPPRGIFRYSLPSDQQPRGTYEARKMLCLETIVPRTMTACTTHLTANRGKDRDRSRADQVKQITQELASKLATNHAVFLGGDFNTTPNAPALDPLWAPGYGRGATGSFIEVDSGPSQENPLYRRSSGAPGSGWTTGGFFTGRKIDYIFVHDVAVIRGEVGRSKFSDHRPLWAEVVQPALQPGDYPG